MRLAASLCVAHRCAGDAGQLRMQSGVLSFRRLQANEPPLQLREDVVLSLLRNASLRVDVILELVLKLQVLDLRLLNLFWALLRLGVLNLRRSIIDTWRLRVLMSSCRALLLLLSQLVHV